jgi:cysteine-rich repeat protein
MRREFPAPLTRRFLSTLAVVLLSLPLQACLEPTSVTCATGLVCPAGQRCSAEQNACIMDDCGDGIVQALEVCDDGNLNDSDGCSSTCKSTEECGNRIVDKGEKCDDGNNVNDDGCSADCLSNELCGNDIVDLALGEVCDDKNTSSGDGCSADCLSREVCGNGIVDRTVNEVCDDGNTLDGDTCSSDCRTADTCGNGVVGPGERCDDGNRSNEDNCLNNCQLATCGDGFVDGQLPTIEKCDDGNADTCGTCDALCQTSKPVQAATGQIVAIAGNANDVGIAEGETITLNDGHENMPGYTSLTFEFDSNDEHPAGHIPIRYNKNDSAKEIAEAIVEAINANHATNKPPLPNLRLSAMVDTDTDADAKTATVHITHKERGSIGNQLILESVDHQGFKVFGMSGGSGYDCPVGMGCKESVDCQRGLKCDAGVCKQP